MSINQSTFKSIFNLPAVIGPYNRAKKYPDEPNSRASCEQFHRGYWRLEDGWAMSGEQRTDLTDAQKRYLGNVRYFKIDNLIEHASFASNTSIKMTPVLVLEIKGGPMSEAQMSETDDYVADVGESFMAKFNVSSLYLGVWSITEVKYFFNRRGIEPKALTDWWDCKDREGDLARLFQQMQRPFASPQPQSSVATGLPTQALAISSGYPQMGSLHTQMTGSTPYPISQSPYSATLPQTFGVPSGIPQISSHSPSSVAAQQLSGISGTFNLTTSSSLGPPQTTVRQTSRALIGYDKPTRSPSFQEHSTQYEVELPGKVKVKIDKNKWNGLDIKGVVYPFYKDYNVYITQIKKRKA